ncbi:MAG TPA: hypothetical protein ENJ09_12395, partial [Planctomycetes bacterium]|nr:hypothetical protein [Planctomycetota bacterium]
MDASTRDSARRGPLVIAGLGGTLLVASALFASPGCGGAPPRSEEPEGVREAPPAPARAEVSVPVTADGGGAGQAPPPARAANEPAPPAV